ncbi:exonuclease VIII [Salmonella enterica subsp. enterica serovar Weslaco]|uniref:Exonuclease VIII n=1 Tax=Salmonella enterica subsp. enterica serovar Weslaco TaxID=1243597 RepID=A0A5X3P041_SALET|nr:exonuclease VIII [Salmonella enterica subsp. enterica serovar Weslaco]EBZ6052087.1 exonuclease VIII [Salmonella enterica subsp. enterica serovar Weslaco]EBZ6059137.1 exonuclease VIII [Salmonella enterica subsp. enterica serovar Weslaco]EBZ6069081.1 exonuclease VIII [Salmonella enterica subsp. enterica serovar Weslaco]EBZ6076131.1 exonuclease VIII [Salmonella enterica subsp. enterica serovar Weslaco]
MSIKQEEYSFYYKVKNESARKRLGFKAGFFWCTAKKQSLALSRGELAMDAAGFDEADFARPVRVHFPVENDIPPEGVFDTKFCENREPGGEDGKTLTLIPGAASGVTDTEENSDNDECQDCEVSVATLPLPQRFLHIFTYAAADKKYLHHATRGQRRHITVMEMEQENSYIQNLLMSIRDIARLEKQDNADMLRLTDAIKTVFSVTKNHQPREFKNFISAWLDTEHTDRGLLVKEWVKGNRVSHITRTASGANAGGGNLTDRGEGFVHDQASLERDVAMGVLARAMDVDIYNPHPAHEKRIDEIIAENKPPFSVFRDKFIAMPGGRDYSRAIVVASVKEAPIGIEVIPAHVTEYLNKVLTETDHTNPDPLIVDIACGRTSQPMPVQGSANDDDEEPQSAGALADEPATPEAVEQDTTEHHPDPQPLENEPSVSQTEAGYQKIRAELHEARKNIPPKNPGDVGKQLAAARGEYVEGISDPNDPKWVHNDYSASNEGEKTEVATDSAADTADYVDHSEDFSNQHEPETSHSEPVADQNEPEMPQTGPEEQSRVPDDIKPGIYFDITNEAYHAGPGVSKSQLDDIAVCPAFYQWRKAAPVDTEKTKALDMGTALHCRLLEPDEFKNRFIIVPEFNRRTTAGKEEEKAFLENCANSGKTVMTAEDGRKLELMYGSVMAHPGCRALLEAEGKTESSIYWTDTETGELCRIRPDKFLTNSPLILDVKKVTDMSRFARHVEEFRYHVQAAMYCEGWKAYSGETPRFAFLAVSESIDCGKYPVHLYILEDEHHDIGYSLFRRDLNTYHECKSSNKWGWGFEVIERPYWARG